MTHIGKAHHALIANLLADGRVDRIEVFDGEESETFTGAAGIQEMVDAVEDASIACYRGRELLGTFYIIPYGVDPGETVMDYSITPFAEQHWALLKSQGVVG